MKKVISLLLTLAMISSVFVGCETKEAEDVDQKAQMTEKGVESKQESEQEAAEDDFSKNIEISFAKIADVPPKEDAPIIKKAEEMYNVDFEYIHIERSKYNEMLGLKISTGEVPDLFMLDGNMLQYAKLQEQGVLKSIPIDMLKKYAPTVYEVQEKYLNNLMIDGELYGLTGEKVDNDYPLNAIWRKDWLENVGIDKVPETLEEAEKAFYAFAKEDPDGNGKNDTYGLGKSGLDMIFGAYGGIPWGPWPQYWLWQEDGQGGLQNAAVMPGMKDALALLQKWYADGVIDPEYVLGENKGGYWAIPTDFVNNKIGFTGLAHFYHWAPETLYEGYSGGPVYSEFKALNPDGEVDYGKPVVGPEGHSGTWLYPVGVGAADMFIFSSKATDEQLIRGLKIMEDQATNYDNDVLYTYGIEGTHWHRDENSQAIVREEAFSQRSDYLAEGINMVKFLPNFEFSKKNNPKLYEFGDMYYNFPGYRNELLVSLPSEGMYRPDLEKLRDQYYTEIISGNKSVDAFDEFVELWNQQGGEQLKQEADEWYKGK